MRRPRMSFSMRPVVADAVVSSARTLDRSEAWVVERAVKEWLARRDAEEAAIGVPVARTPAELAELVERVCRIEAATFDALPETDEVTKAEAEAALAAVKAMRERWEGDPATGAGAVTLARLAEETFRRLALPRVGPPRA